MKWSELEKIAKKMGWYLERHGTRHDIYLHPDKSKDDILFIARHSSKEVANGTFEKIKKQIGF
jgi:predicted RNA binding protein YcfA (HicA-like mRNA interferase family)